MQKYQARRRWMQGSVNIELVTIMGALAKPLALISVAVVRARQVSRTLTGANNVRQIATGLFACHT